MDPIFTQSLRSYIKRLLVIHHHHHRQQHHTDTETEAFWRQVITKHRALFQGTHHSRRGMCMLPSYMFEAPHPAIAIIVKHTAPVFFFQEEEDRDEEKDLSNWLQAFVACRDELLRVPDGLRAVKVYFKNKENDGNNNARLLDQLGAVEVTRMEDAHLIFEKSGIDLMPFDAVPGEDCVITTDVITNDNGVKHVRYHRCFDAPSNDFFCIVEKDNDDRQAQAFPTSTTPLYCLRDPLMLPFAYLKKSFEANEWLDVADFTTPYTVRQIVRIPLLQNKNKKDDNNNNNNNNNN
eukprot:PhM_4_TR1458/c1_g1_i1/m.8829